MRLPWPKSWNRPIAITATVLVVLAGVGFGLFWWKFLAGEDQVLADETERFHYGTLGGDLIAGIPYPIFMILPRVFPDLLAEHAGAGYGPEKAVHGGYGAFGLAWKEGDRLPIGFSVKKQGYERVTVNCALCHTTVYRFDPEENPSFATGGPSHGLNVQGMLRFLFAAARDRRFTGTRMLPEMALQFPFDWLDLAIYQFYLIPKTKVLLRLAERELAWMDDRTAWGPGRDDAFNLPKFIITRASPEEDDSVGNTDFPALWQMAQRDGHLLHWGGEAKTVAAVNATSAIGTGALPVGDFNDTMAWLEDFMRDLSPPPFPTERIDQSQTDRGAALFQEHCADCHDGPRTGTAIPLEEIGTDPEHVLTWTEEDAISMNRRTSFLGLIDAELQAAQGYVARPLVGVWLLAPYLHNGSVPTLMDLLTPPSGRPAVFWRGYDLYDPDRLGFEAVGPRAKAHGFRHDTALKGNGNSGHDYGTALPEADKQALIEFLKTL